MSERVDHPAHYGGADNPYEAIKVVEAWGLGFCLGNAVKYICRAEKKDNALEDLKKARWYLDREIQRLEGLCAVVPLAQPAPSAEQAARVGATGTTRPSIREGGA